MSVAEVARDHQERVVGISDKLSDRSLQLWNRVDVANLTAGWVAISQALLAQVSAAQVATARSSDPYVSRISAEQDFEQDSSKLTPQAFTGIDGSGRDVEGLLFGAVTTTKEAIGAGLGTSQAFESGAVYLAAMMKTAMADIGRAADLSSATGRGYTHYVRVVAPGACSRCAMLAGISSFSRAFKRHVACRCTAAPSAEGVPKGLFDNPSDYFNSLSRAEQDRIFTKSGAEAIRSGAEISRVVSARRGAKGISYSHAIGDKALRGGGRRLQRSVIGRRSDGSPIYGYVTTEGTTVRGEYAHLVRRTGGTAEKVGDNRYRTVKRARLMPETIVGLTDDLELRQVLLRDAGYLDQPLNFRGNWIAQRARLEMQDHLRAEEFYRSLGIRL